MTTIVPVVLPHDTASGVVKALIDQFMVFDYATQYASTHATIDSVEVFNFTDWNGFVQFAQSKNFDYESSTEKKIKELRDLAMKENFPIATEIMGLETKVKAVMLH